MIYRIIDKATGLFLRDDFVWDKEFEAGITERPRDGFKQPLWVSSIDKDGVDKGRWIESDIK